jgi:hypothetical protein
VSVELVVMLLELVHRDITRGAVYGSVGAGDLAARASFARAIGEGDVTTAAGAAAAGAHRGRLRPLGPARARAINGTQMRARSRRRAAARAPLLAT